MIVTVDGFVHGRCTVDAVDAVDLLTLDAQSLSFVQLEIHAIESPTRTGLQIVASAHKPLRHKVLAFFGVFPRISGPVQLGMRPQQSVH